MWQYLSIYGTENLVVIDGHLNMHSYNQILGDM